MAKASEIILEDQIVDAEAVKMQVRSPFVDESLKKLEWDSIWNLKDLVKREIKNFKEEYRDVPGHWVVIIRLNTKIDEDYIESVYNEITSYEQSIDEGTLKFRNILKFLLVWHASNKDEIDSTKYGLILEVAKIVNDIKAFRINGYADLILSKVLKLCRNKETDFEKIGSAYLFAHKLSEIIKHRYLIYEELTDLSACIKSRIYDLMCKVKEISYHTPEEFKEIRLKNDDLMKKAIKYILIARENNTYLNVFIESFIFSLNKWREISTISENFDYSILEKETEFEDFDTFIKNNDIE